MVARSLGALAARLSPDTIAIALGRHRPLSGMRWRGSLAVTAAEALAGSDEVLVISERWCNSSGARRAASGAPPGLAVCGGGTITDTVNLIVQHGTRRLTAREREVLALVAAGISNKGIARALQVSPNTVKFHVAALLDKLDAASRAEAGVAALRRGELTP
jgi:DNA-binding NarL/FixJ family response regulator